MTAHADLLAEATVIRELGGQVIDATDIGTYAIELAVNNWAVFPLRGKIPAIAGGRGVLDATTDLEQVTAWWAGQYRGCNIGARVPDSLFVLDVDNLDALTELENQHGALPETLTTISGRASGGKHLYYRRPAGKISHRRLPKGIEIKTSSGYTVQPPSIHPGTGNRYTRIEAPVAAPPTWLVALLKPEPPAPPPRPNRRPFVLVGPSVADEYTVKASWATILGLHNWECLDADPEADGARWRHPSATSKWSATIRHGCLFVYSPNTPFDVTEEDNPKGYTKFRAYAVLDHGGDMSAAAKALQSVAT